LRNKKNRPSPFHTPAIENFEKAEKYMDHPNLPGRLAYLYFKKASWIRE